MQCVIYYVTDSSYFDVCDVMVTWLVTTLLFFFIYLHSISLKYLQIYDVITYVTPIMSSLTKKNGGSMKLFFSLHDCREILT
jgi:hypothetical protein